MNKITQITEKMLSKFFDLKITDGISSVIEGLNRAFKEFCNDYIALQLEELDEIIFKEKSLRRGWDIIHKDVPRTWFVNMAVLSINADITRTEKQDAKHIWLIFLRV